MTNNYTLIETLPVTWYGCPCGCKKNLTCLFRVVKWPVLLPILDVNDPQMKLIFLINTDVTRLSVRRTIRAI